MFDFNLSDDEAAIDIALAFYDEGYNVVPLQRANKKPPKKFESSGNDIVSGEFGLDRFAPK